MTTINKFEQERHQLIQQLLQQVQTMKSIRQKESAINHIAATILRSRPLCRRFNGTPLKGVYQEIYSQAKEELLNYLRQYLINSNPLQTNDRLLRSKQLQSTYLYALQREAFRRILNDTQLKKMGLSAQKFLVNSELRSYALTELIKAIKLSGRLGRPHLNKFSPSLYQILYEEALTETFTYICLNIDLYDPYRGSQKFMNWVNFQLDKFILKCYERYNKFAKYEFSSYQDLEQIQQPLTNLDLCQLLQEYLSQDPDEVFQDAHVRNRPDANFSQIALAKFSGKSWSEISRQLDIPVPTLSSFYNRWCRRFAPLLETELKKYF